MGKLNELSGLWERTSANGTVYASAQLKEDVTLPAGTWIQLWNNDKGDNERRPDFKLTYSLPEGDQAPQQQTQRQGSGFDRMKNQGQGQQQAAPAASRPGDQLQDDDIPF